jgi:hypothetical protein
VAQGLTRAPEPTAEQKAEREAALAASHRSGPTDLPYADLSVAAGSPGPEVPSITASAKRATARSTAAAPAPAAPGDFVALDNPIDPGLGANASFVQEPSSDNAGANIFQSGNWYATRSFDGGATFDYVNPAMFGPGFCCDQVVLYDPGRDRWFWLLQYNNRLVLANSGDLINWCFYNWFPGNAGFAGEFDFNDLAISTNYIYIASNVFLTSGASGSTMIRLPIDPQITCGGFGYNFFTSTTLGFTWKPVSGAYDVMYWGTNWAGTLGSFFRVFKWAENSGSIFWFDRAISAFGFYTRNSGQNCGGGAVTNWCQFSDSRVLGGARYTDRDGVARLVFSWNAKQGPPYGLPFPFSERAYFREGDFAYLGSDRLWLSWAAVQFMSLATNARGHVGMTVIYGGGIASSYYYPSGGVLIQDDVSPNQPWQLVTNAAGTGNTCTYNGLWRYGDYVTTRPLRPTNLAWVGTNYVIAGNNCGGIGWYSEPHQVQFGRSRDLPGAFNRWT